jgi:hypothetical protein
MSTVADSDRTRVQVKRPCQTCAGAGVSAHLVCLVCGATVSTHTGEEIVEDLPCGHDFEQSQSQWATCAACAGHGFVLVELTGPAGEAWKRRRLRRGLLLLALALIPLSLFGLAVAGREPEYVCGSWWYGLSGLFLLLLFS